MTFVAVWGVASLAQKLAAPQDTSIPCRSVAVLRLFVERAESFHHIVKPHRLFAAGRTPQSRCRLNGACIRSPRREDRAFFIQGQIGVVDHVRWMLERLCRMQKVIKIISLVSVFRSQAVSFLIRVSSESSLVCQRGWLEQGMGYSSHPDNERRCSGLRCGPHVLNRLGLVVLDSVA